MLGGLPGWSSAPAPALVELRFAVELVAPGTHSVSIAGVPPDVLERLEPLDVGQRAALVEGLEGAAAAIAGDGGDGRLVSAGRIRRALDDLRLTAAGSSRDGANVLEALRTRLGLHRD